MILTLGMIPLIFIISKAGVGATKPAEAVID
jgi:hypothetical protein